MRDDTAAVILLPVNYLTGSNNPDLTRIPAISSYAISYKLI